jgi:hypothetical protein
MQPAAKVATALLGSLGHQVVLAGAGRMGALVALAEQFHCGLKDSKLAILEWKVLVALVAQAVLVVWVAMELGRATQAAVALEVQAERVVSED